MTIQLRNAANPRPLRPRLSTAPLHLPCSNDRAPTSTRGFYKHGTACRRTCAKSRLMCMVLIGRRPSSLSWAMSWPSSPTRSRSPHLIFAAALRFPSRFRFLGTALPSCLGPTASILRPPSSKWTRFWTPLAAGLIQHSTSPWASLLSSRRHPASKQETY